MVSTDPRISQYSLYNTLGNIISDLDCVGHNPKFSKEDYLLFLDLQKINRVFTTAVRLLEDLHKKRVPLDREPAEQIAAAAEQFSSIASGEKSLSIVDIIEIQHKVSIARQAYKMEGQLVLQTQGNKPGFNFEHPPESQVILNRSMGSVSEPKRTTSKTK